MASLHRRRAPMHEINVVPYIDVMLVLLIIFMVTAPLVTPGVIDLPSVAKSSTPPAAPLEVMLREDQSITLRLRDAKGVAEERRIGRDELAAAVRAHQARNPELAVVIAADKGLRYENVLKVMDELQRQQVKRIGLAVTPADGKK